MSKYKIVAPNKEYTGLSAGVSFVNGEGYTEDDWLVDWFKNKGYEATKEQMHDMEEKTEDVEEKNILNNLTVKELKELARDKGIEGYLDMKKEELIKSLEGVEDVKQD